MGVLLLVCLGVIAAGSAVADDQTTMTVEVTDQDGTVIEDAEVTANWDDGSGTDVTRSNGQAYIDVPSDGDIDVTVEHENFVQNVPKTGVDPTDTVGVEMAPPGTATITVVSEDGETVDDVQLALSHTEIGNHDDGEQIATATTESDGTAEISDIEQRTYAIETDRSGYLGMATEFDLDDEEISETLEVESSRVDIEFNVTDDHDHFSSPVPLEGAAIEVDGSSAGETGSDGTQVTRIDVNDEYEVVVDKAGYDAETRTIEVGEQEEMFGMSIQRTPEIIIEPLQSAVVTGQPTLVTITDAYGDPVAEASVIVNDEHVGETDEQGMTMFNVTDTGENTIEATSNGLESTVTIEGVDPDAVEEVIENDGTDTDDADDTADADDADDTADEADDEDTFGPGFGALAAIGAIAGLTILLLRRE